MLEDSTYHHLHPGHPLIIPICLSSLAFNLVTMSFYNHFCFLQHICTLTFPCINLSVVFPSAEGSMHDVLAEMCYFYAQNLLDIMMLLPHTGLALTLVLLIPFFHSEKLPDGLSLSDVVWSIAQALSADAKGILIASMSKHNDLFSMHTPPSAIKYNCVPVISGHVYFLLLQYSLPFPSGTVGSKTVAISGNFGLGGVWCLGPWDLLLSALEIK